MTRVLLQMWLGGVALSLLHGQSFNDYEVAPHRYFEAPLKDPVSRLLDRLKGGEVSFDDGEGKVLVKRLLEALSVPEESQVLVFSKTSLQRRTVDPQHPRALYFNEDVYLGWMPEGRIEITSMDPNLGGIFYFQRPLDQTSGPLFQREESCLGCHAGSATNFLPGLLGQSVYPDSEGRNLRSVSSFDRSHHGVPIGDRWGGWYVTGYHGEMRHLGNAIASGGRRNPVIDPEAGANASSLDAYFDTDLHLRKDSDVLALLILDHQISMHHWIMEAQYRVRHALHAAKLEATTREDLRSIDSWDWQGLDQCVDRLIRYLLFADEAPLGEKEWKGAGDYRRVFLADRRVDKKGRSLKDLRMKEHLFKFRCSYMIYSKAFAGLPVGLKEEIFHRLKSILVGEWTSDGEYAYLGREERQAIAEILTETLPELAAAWKKDRQS